MSDVYQDPLIFIQNYVIDHQLTPFRIKNFLLQLIKILYVIFTFEEKIKTII